MQVIPNILFVLYSDYNGDTPYRIWVDLKNPTTQWKITCF